MRALRRLAGWPVCRARSWDQSECHTATSMGMGIHPTRASRNAIPGAVSKRGASAMPLSPDQSGWWPAASTTAARVEIANALISNFIARSRPR
jgi:hypothetical protein